MVSVYIKGQKIDLFNDEKIDFNSSIKDINDISKIFTDFSQSFTIPASHTNSQIFTHWYDATVDGDFNANIQVEGYLELNTVPYKYGTIQLNECKLLNGLPYSYQITFYGKVVNLSQLFGDEEIKHLDLTSFDHDYSVDVMDSLSEDILFDGDLFYPLINASNEMSIGTTGARDLIDPANTIFYKEFKFGIRLIRIIEAIEQRYSVEFSRDFFDRSVFYNLFLLFHKDADYLKAYGDELEVDISASGTIATAGGTVNTTDNTITFIRQETSPTVFRKLILKITPDTGYENENYFVRIYRDGVLVSTQEDKGTKSFLFPSPPVEDIFNPYAYSAVISSFTGFSFTGEYTLTETEFSGGITTNVGTTTTSLQTVSGILKVKDQCPELKIKDLFTSLVKMFNLIIQPISGEKFYIDTLDSWYNKGKLIDLSKYVDIKEISVKRPNVKREIQFLYQKAGSILAERYFDNNQIGYGDLKAKYDILGDELKVESSFENFLYERLQNENTGDLTDIQAGYLIDKNLKPYKGKPILFYKNGFTDIDDDLNIQPSKTYNRIFSIGTEDNLIQSQITNTLNFGDDVSSYFYSSIETGLYFNFWKTYIEDLYNTKTRVYSVKCIIPFANLFGLKLNDRILINDVKYKISSIKCDLTTGESTIEIFSDFSKPISSIDSLTSLTVDRTDITVDRTDITVDRTILYDAVLSYIIPGISRDNYLGTAANEHFEVKISASSIWSINIIDDGYGVDWVFSNKYSGSGIDYIRATISTNDTASYRSVIMRFNIEGTDYNLLIEQQP